MCESQGVLPELVSSEQAHIPPIQDEVPSTPLNTPINTILKYRSTGIAEREHGKP